MSARDCFGSRHAGRSSGFTLIEIMVALIVTSIGLLGIAKMQALAYASTGSAAMRSLVALQAAGLAASMHANRTYWAAGTAPASFTITGTVISDATLNSTAVAPTYCQAGGGGAPCPSDVMAAFDLHTYATALNQMLSNSDPVTTVTCPAAIPVNCTIQVTWNENAVSINTQGVANTSQSTFAPAYTLYVEP
jgi:type IV pilus assembly protein PilV